MEFNLSVFSNKLREYFIGSPLFPYYAISQLKDYEIGKRNMTKSEKARQQSDSAKHPNRHPVHLQEVARQSLEHSLVSTDNMITFDYGNTVLESNYPYYHILENSKVIRKRNRGTKKTKGSEDLYRIKAQRDYERVFWNGKTFAKEYSKNIRGSRNRLSHVSHWGIVDGQGEWLNKDAGSYLNVHYHYIENILEQDVIYKLATEFNMKVARKETTDLIEDYSEQEGVSKDKLMEIFGSFME